MIYTVTLNPSLDYIVDVDNFKIGMTNRTVDEQLLPGGKGLNVSMVLHHLKTQSTALGFRAGFTGDEIQRRLDALGIKNDLIRLPEGNSRINVKLKFLEETEINGMGPMIGDTYIKALFERLDGLTSGDVLVLAGSIPSSLPDSIYKDIMIRLEKRGVEVVVDAAGKLLVQVLAHHPFLIKPNHHELGEIFGVTLKTRESVIPYGRALKRMGARNVLISMGGEGAVFLAENDRIYMARPPKGRLVNSVGAGDSMVAGFLAGWLGFGDDVHAFKMGIAAGSASAFSPWLALGEDIMALYHTVCLEPDMYCRSTE